jgi:hypothetical protein
MASALSSRHTASACSSLEPGTKRAAKRWARDEVSIHLRRSLLRERKISRLRTISRLTPPHCGCLSSFAILAKNRLLARAAQNDVSSSCKCLPSRDREGAVVQRRASRRRSSPPVPVPLGIARSPVGFARLALLEIIKQIEIKPGELRCPRCFGRDIVPSLPRGIGDAVMRRVGRIPRHCRSCGRRFYADPARIAAARAADQAREFPAIKKAGA